jgi:hypothetical protein
MNNGSITLITGQNCVGKTRRLQNIGTGYYISGRRDVHTSDEITARQAAAYNPSNHSSACEIAKEILGVDKRCYGSKSWDNLMPVISTLLNSPHNTNVAIENPEIFLSPLSQLKLTDYFVESVKFGLYLWVESNSEHIINQLRIAVREGRLNCQNVKILFLTHNDNFDVYIDSKGKLHQITDKGEVISTPVGFFCETVNSMAKLF